MADVPIYRLESINQTKYSRPEAGETVKKSFWLIKNKALILIIHFVYRPSDSRIEIRKPNAQKTVEIIMNAKSIPVWAPAIFRIDNASINNKKMQIKE